MDPELFNFVVHAEDVPYDGNTDSAVQDEQTSAGETVPAPPAAKVPKISCGNTKAKRSDSYYVPKSAKKRLDRIIKKLSARLEADRTSQTYFAKVMQKRIWEAECEERMNMQSTSILKIAEALQAADDENMKMSHE